MNTMTIYIIVLGAILLLVLGYAIGAARTRNKVDGSLEICIGNGDYPPEYTLHISNLPKESGGIAVFKVYFDESQKNQTL